MGGYAQGITTTKKKATFKLDFLAPTILVSTGLIASTDNEVFDKWEIQEVRENHFPNFHTNVDDYLQYLPIVAAYTLDLCGVKSQNRLGRKSFLLVKSELFMVAMVVPLKYIVAEPRPDTGAKDAFPSGHTAQAFVAATFLHKEYGHLSLWYSIAGYSVATTVGVLRIINNRHWASDVFVGAGVGILATNLAYLTARKSNSKVAHGVGIRWAPFYSQKSYGLALSCSLP